MMRVTALTKTYGAQTVLDDVSFILTKGEMLGLVGPNGSGKSTLLKLIAGLETPDTGHVWIDPADRVAYLPQFPLDDLRLTVGEALVRDTPAADLQRRLITLEARMGTVSGANLDSSLAEYAHVREDFERAGGYELEARLEQVMAGLELDAGSPENQVRTLSGGNKTKISLGRLLLSNATILLLDEPTNYLDLQALLWLEQFVAAENRSYLIVSHDRRFLDRTVGGILELSEVSHSLRLWPGNYSAYAEGRLRERRKLLEAYADQQAEIRRIEEDIRRTKEQARGVEARTKSGLGADHQRRLAKKVARKAKARERRLERSLEGTGTIEKPTQTWGLHLGDLARTVVDDNRIVLDIEDLSASYGEHAVLQGLGLLLRGRDRVALMGPNGSGKSTLVRCIVGQMPYQGQLRLGASIRPALLSQETEDLPADQTVLDVFRSRTDLYEDEARTYLHRFLFSGDDPLKRVSVLSYGQRSKLALATLILSDANFLILDEPTSHMDMPALEAIEDALAAFRGPMLVVSHDRYFLERLRITRVEVMTGGILTSLPDVETYEQIAQQRTMSPEE